MYVPLISESATTKYSINAVDRYKIFAILSLIQERQSKEGKFEANQFVPIPKECFAAIDKEKYKQFLNLLIHKLNLVIPFISDKGKESYSAYEGNNFCKKYMFRDGLKFDKIMYAKSQKLIDKNSDSLIITPDGEMDDCWIHWTNTERRITLDQRGHDELPDKFFGLFGTYMNALKFGKKSPVFNDNSSRFYCKTVEMPNEFKKYLLFDNEDCLINYDISGAYINFIKEIVYGNEVIPTGGEGHSPIPTYVTTLLSSDSYHIFGENLGLSRDIIKHEFNLFLNSKRAYKKSHRFMKVMRENGMEKMADFILKTDEIWRELETFETTLLVKITRKCIDAEIPIVRQHDGFLLPKNYNQKMKEILKEVLKDYTFISFKESPMNQQKEKTLPIEVDRFPNPHNESDLGWSIKILRNYNNDLKDHFIDLSISSLVKLKKKLKRV